jgi:hypothetical protein
MPSIERGEVWLVDLGLAAKACPAANHQAVVGHRLMQIAGRATFNFDVAEIVAVAARWGGRS